MLCRGEDFFSAVTSRPALSTTWPYIQYMSVACLLLVPWVLIPFRAMSDHGSWVEFGPLLNDNKVLSSSVQLSVGPEEGCTLFQVGFNQFTVYWVFCMLYFWAVTSHEVSMKQSILLQLKEIDFRFALITMMDLEENIC